MQFSIDAKVLSESLSFVGKAVPSRPSHPVLACVLVESGSNGIQLTGFDLSTALVRFVECDLFTGGKVAIPYQIVNNVVSKLSGQITVAAIYDDEKASTTITIKSDNGEYSFSGMSAEDYPQLPECTGDKLELPSDLLSQGLDLTIPFASIDDTKQVLTGVRIICKDNQLEFASTDGHRLAVASFKLEQSVQDFAVTLHGKSLTALSKLDGETVFLSVNEVNARFQVGETTLICRLLDGNYPQYQQLMPRQFSRKVTVTKRHLLSALDRLQFLTDQKSSLAFIKFFTNFLEAKTSATNLGNGKETVPCESVGNFVSNDGVNFEIAFNNKYVMDGLKQIDGLVTISLNENNQPFVFSPEDGSFRYLVMPVQLVR
jgi:DNA polymerase-3 subunit beta